MFIHHFMALVVVADTGSDVAGFFHAIGSGITQITGLDVKSMIIGALIVLAIDIPVIGRLMRR